MTTLAFQHRMSDETAERLRTTITALHRGGESVEEAMRYAEQVCAKANCEFDPEGVAIVIEVYGGRYDGARIVGAREYVASLDGDEASGGSDDAIDATPESVTATDVTPSNATAEVINTPAGDATVKSKKKSRARSKSKAAAAKAHE